MQKIETERLTLREWTSEDLDSAAEINQDPAFYEFLAGPLSKTETAAMIEDMRKHWGKYGFGFFACILKKTKELIGYIGFNVPDFEAHFTPCVEISWYFSPQAWGKGYASEAACALLKYGFEKLKFQEIVSFTATSNIRSIRIMEKLGMVRDISGDFDHPKIPIENPLRRQVLFRITKDQYVLLEQEKTLSSLNKAQQIIIVQMIQALSRLQGIEAIVLGGSHARGTARADSDVDLGLYYSEISPPSIESIQNLAKQYSTIPDCVVTQFYEWGPWVNGGAWIHTNSGKIDWLYRNIDQMDRVLADAERGLFSWDFRQQPPFGFFSITYLADLHDNIALYDPKGICKKLKSAVATYPEPLRRAIIQEHLWSIEFSLMNAKKYCARGCVYATVGCMTRMAAELTQVLFDLNRIYFVTEKGALEMIDAFTSRPENYAKRINAILSHPGTGDHLTNSLQFLEEVVHEVIDLADPIYQPKYKTI